MEGEWLIRALDDLATQARRAGLPALAEHLAQARLLALIELASIADAPAEDDAPADGGGRQIGPAFTTDDNSAPDPP